MYVNCTIMMVHCPVPLLYNGRAMKSEFLNGKCDVTVTLSVGVCLCVGEVPP